MFIENHEIVRDKQRCLIADNNQLSFTLLKSKAAREDSYN